MGEPEPSTTREKSKGGLPARLDPCFFRCVVLRSYRGLRRRRGARSPGAVGLPSGATTEAPQTHPGVEPMKVRNRSRSLSKSTVVPNKSVFARAGVIDIPPRKTLRVQTLLISGSHLGATSIHNRNPRSPNAWGCGGLEARVSVIACAWVFFLMATP